MSSSPTSSMKEDDVIAIIKACTIPFVDMAANLELLCFQLNSMTDRELQVCRRNRTAKPAASPRKSRGTPRRKKNVEKTKGIQSGYQIFVSENSIKGLDLMSQMKVLSPMWASIGADKKNEYMQRAADIRRGLVAGGSPQNPSKDKLVQPEMHVDPQQTGEGSSSKIAAKAPSTNTNDNFVRDLQKSQLKGCSSTDSLANDMHGGAEVGGSCSNEDSSSESDSDASVGCVKNCIGKQAEDTSIQY